MCLGRRIACRLQWLRWAGEVPVLGDQPLYATEPRHGLQPLSCPRTTATSPPSSPVCSTMWKARPCWQLRWGPRLTAFLCFVCAECRVTARVCLLQLAGIGACSSSLLPASRVLNSLLPLLPTPCLQPIAVTQLPASAPKRSSSSGPAHPAAAAPPAGRPPAAGSRPQPPQQPAHTNPDLGTSAPILPLLARMLQQQQQ